MHPFFSKYKGFHILFWAGDLAFWTYMTHVSYGAPLPGALVSNIIWLSLQAVMAYTIIYSFMPRYFNRKKYLLFAAASAGILIATSVLNGWIQVFGIVHGMPKTLNSVLYFSFISGMTNFYTAFVFIAAKAIKDKLAADRRHRMMEQEKAENELRFLKSQMNPHFLFNAINSIYVLIKKDQDLAANTLATFADMLRYQLYECNTGVIPVEREMYYLNNYVQMEQLRKGRSLQLDYQVGTGVKNFSIAPLLLIPFVENAFKYVSAYTNRDNNIRLHLHYEKNIFTLDIENSIESIQPADATIGGIGLENVRRRLELIYKNNYHLQITPGNTSYRVLLTINII